MLKPLLLAAGAVAALASSPALAQAAGEENALVAPSCDRACLLDTLGSYMDALRAGDAARLPLAKDAVFTENNVPISLDRGLWATVTAVDETGLEAADPLTGNAAWFGSAREKGNPVIYAVRIHVEGGLIDEIETVVHRKTALPAPFGDTENMVHDPEYYDVLPPEERSSRERMHSIADGYFDTVQLNDGQVFTNFSDDCGRLENGIRTTSNNRDDGRQLAAEGCEAQFRMGIYRINKRIRRDFFIFDEERGVAVGRGFFDHANEFDRYLLTNGQEMRTALKWPNSITLLEAFRIKNQEIQRIEAVFTYVPYFMHNPFWGPDSTPPAHAPQPEVCDTECLTANARSVMAAYVGNDWQSVNWADQVAYTENSVGIRIGESVWRTATAVDDNPLIVADPLTGKAVWIGRIEEHGQPAWAAMTVSAAGDKVGGIDAVIRRKEYGPPYAEPGSAPSYSALPQSQRSSREDMLAAADSFYAALNSQDGTVPEAFGENCNVALNGQDLGPCAPPFAAGRLQTMEQVRDRSVLAVDVERGLVVYSTFEDFAAIDKNYVDATGESFKDNLSYPLTQQVVELFRIEGGKIVQVRAYTSELPYGMRPHGAGY